ncbi:hypothetical protein JCM19235_5475 [Vibrio maritimus]|uniref:Uncharacterized protein n=1 Tax=Vibrio maritimus TaxID=990268 RepID=A0A090RNU1_9VIBR|nr:hypothetical protein JCM19235_5475 [Vibrio maritimus]
MKKLLSIQSLIIMFCLSLTLIPVFYKVDKPGMRLPECSMGELVETPIFFFVSKTVIENYGLEEVTSEIERSVKKSNVIMKNSCIPMKRSVAEVSVVDFSGRALFDIDKIREDLAELIGEEKHRYIESSPNHFYGVILAVDDGYFEEYIIGTTNPDVNSQFFLLSEHADEYTLEHELGHLSWAWHDDRSWFKVLDETLEKHTSDMNKDRLKPYARGYQCGGAGTIMSYESELLSIYSSPEITNNGRACGDPLHADNARQLREFAEALRVKLQAIQVSTESSS